MHAIHLEVPDEILYSMRKSPEEFAGEVRRAAAAFWYNAGHLSQERAAQFANLSREEFFPVLERFGITPFQETAEEIVEALK
jgi:hypothetical protein